jgi:hypothetical protein
MQKNDHDDINRAGNTSLAHQCAMVDSGMMMDSRSKNIDRLHAITSSDDVRLPCTAATATRPRVFDSRKKGLASLAGAKMKEGELSLCVSTRR